MAKPLALLFSKHRILKFSLLSVFIFIIILWINRIPVLTWGLKSYFKSQDLKLDLKIKRFDFFNLEIADIDISDLFMIDQFKIKSNTPLFFIPSAIELQLSVNRFNFKILDHFGFKNSENKTQSSTAFSYIEATEICEKLKAHQINIHLNELIISNQSHILDLKIDHLKNQPLFDVQFQSQDLIRRSIKNKTTGHLILKCDADQITVDLKDLKTQIAELELESHGVHFKDFNISSHRSGFIWSKNQEAQFDLDFGLSGIVVYQKKDYRFKIKSLNLETPLKPDKIINEKLVIQLKKIELKGEHNVNADQIKIAFDSIETNPLDFTALTQIKNFSYFNSDKTINLKGLQSELQINKKSDTLSALASISDKDKNINFKKISILYQPQSWSLELKPKENFIRLGSALLDIRPSLKKSIQSLNGQIYISGSLKEVHKKLEIFFRSNGKNIDVVSTYGRLTGLNFKHDVRSLTHFNSSPKQEISIEKISVGQQIDQFKLIYQVTSPNQILGQSLEFKNDGMNVNATNFKLDPKELLVKDLNLKITHLKLEKVLALAVGPHVRAEGTLTGGLEIDYGKKRAKIVGHLDSDSKGWIRYRAAVQNQVQGLQPSDTPVSILNNYLFNFHYNQLSLDISTEKNYDMKAILGAYGQNPDYLSGKPLKLNINLEQNLLAALRSMVLSYDLPAQLKETLEKRIGDE